MPLGYKYVAVIYYRLLVTMRLLWLILIAGSFCFEERLKLSKTFISSQNNDQLQASYINLDSDKLLITRPTLHSEVNHCTFRIIYVGS